jgi:hypothetical protein
MSRSMAVGLLAAVAAAMSALVGLSHGDLIWVMIADGSAATGVAAYLASPTVKKISAM